MFRAALLTVLALAACQGDVVVGRNGLRGADDAGVTDAGASSDGGSVQLDAGADAGMADAGTPDAGAPDSGAPDAGQADAGPLDAGEVDAGPADAVLDITGPFALELGEPATYVIRGRNIGGAVAEATQTLALFPPEYTIVSAPGCLTTMGSANVTCIHGDLDAGASVSFSVHASNTTGLGFFQIRGAIESVSLEPVTTNNASAPIVAWTPRGASALPVTLNRTFDLTWCIGNNLTSFSQCVVGSRVVSTMIFFADGGLESVDAGIESFTGQWGQAPHQRNLAVRLFDGVSYGSGFVGGVDGGCFEGLGYPLPREGDGGLNSTAWQGCFR